jgi:hypothetical protein
MVMATETIDLPRGAAREQREYPALPDRPARRENGPEKNDDRLEDQTFVATPPSSPRSWPRVLPGL